MAYGQQKIHASGQGKPHLRATGCSRYLVPVSVAMRKEHKGGRCLKGTTRACLVSSFLRRTSNRETENYAIAPGVKTAAIGLKQGI